MQLPQQLESGFAKDIQSLLFTFITEDGEQKMTLTEYHSKEQLRHKIGLITVPTIGRQSVFMGTTIISFPDELLEHDKKRRRAFDEVRTIVDTNPLKYFVPQHEVVRNFLNDRESTMKILTAGNGFGKSVSGWIDCLLSIVPTKPDWPIFTTCGVERRPYTGSKKMGGVGIVTYEWNNHITTIWPQIIKRWTPKEFLGDWADGGKSVVNWKNNPHIEIAGTPVWFFACSQAQTVFEASAMDIYWWDEQGEEAKFNGANARVRRRNGRHVMTLTPHKVEGRPDTGAGSYIHKMYLGEITSGLRVRAMKADILALPDWIYSEESKAAAVKEWITEPTDTGNIRKLREGLSRINGDFHESSGLVFDDWSPPIHVIEPFDIPKEWCRYRALDHGRVEPTAGLCAAVSPTGDIVLYTEYYQTNMMISENTPRFIEACGNSRIRLGQFEDLRGKMYERYEEVQKIQFRKSLMDPRSAARKADDSTFTLQQMYMNEGLKMSPADGQPFATTVPIAREFLKVDSDRTHIQSGQNGAPRVYVFDTLKFFIKEISHYVNEEVTRTARDGTKSASEKPRGKNDHLMTCFIWLCMEGMPYVAPFYVDEEEEEGVMSDGVIRDPVTGY